MGDDIEKREHSQLIAEKNEKPSIGGTSAATIALEAAGKQPPFGRSAFDEWCYLTGLKREGDEDNDRLEFGRLMEEPLAIRFERRTGLKVVKVPTLIHPKFPWVTGHMDRATVEEPGDVELKTVGFYRDRNQEWSDPRLGEAQKVPLAYLMQTVWYNGIPRGLFASFERRIYIAAQFDYQPLRIYCWEPDDTVKIIWKRMFEACQEFWEKYVVTKDPPPAPLSGPAAKRWLDVKYPIAGSEILTGDNRTIELARAYKEAAKKEAVAKKEKERLAIEFGKIIGSAYGVTATDGPVTVSVSRPYIEKALISYERKAYRSLHVSLKGEKEELDE